MAHPMQHYGEREEPKEPELLMQVWRLHDGTLTAAVPFEDLEPGTYRLVEVVEYDAGLTVNE